MRFNDLLWLRLAAWQDPPFADGAPYRLAPTRFDSLQQLGLVAVSTAGKSTRAIATVAGHDRLAAIRETVQRKRTLADEQSGQGAQRPAAADERAEDEGNGVPAGDRRRVAARPLCPPEQGVQP